MESDLSEEKPTEAAVVVNGDLTSTTPPPTIVTSPSGGFRHHLPQIAGTMRNSKIAQSKASAKRDNAETLDDVEATLHVEGTGKVIKMDADLKTELCVQEAGDTSPGIFKILSPLQTCIVDSR